MKSGVRCDLGTRGRNADIAMTHMRPGQRIRFWSPKFLNEPDVAAPGLLRLLAGVGMFSVAGVPMYAVALAVTGTDIDNAEAAYVAVVHFVLPLGLFYAVNANSPLSRPIVAVYFLILGVATYLGKGFLGHIAIDQVITQAATIVILPVVLLWLYATPKMRVYYALIRGRDIPFELEERRNDLTTTDWLGPRSKAMLSAVLDNMETIVLMGFILATLAAFWGMGI